MVETIKSEIHCTYCMKQRSEEMATHTNIHRHTQTVQGEYIKHSVIMREIRGVNWSFQGSLLTSSILISLYPVMAPLQKNSHTQFASMGNKLVKKNVCHSLMCAFIL